MPLGMDTAVPGHRWLQVLEPQQGQSIWGQLCPPPVQSKPTPIAFTQCQPRAGSCPAGQREGQDFLGAWGRML